MKRKPRILLLIDKRNWAFDICAKEYTKFLSNDFQFVFKYLERPRPIVFPFCYDLIHVFWWGEKYYKKFHWPKKKILKEVSSHRWGDDPRYGPCTPGQFCEKYLDDAGTVVCTSRRLYDAIKPFEPRAFLVNNGYAPDVFYLKKERSGSELTLCWVGNIDDSVKGIRDILVPAAERSGTRIDIASNLKHEQLCDFYNAHDVFLLGSKHEASPLTLLEAMACGCFPICTDVGIVPELIEHRKNGYIVKERSIEAFMEAIAWCKSHLTEIRQAGVQNSKIVYEKRRWEVCSESFRAMYQGALSRD